MSALHLGVYGMIRVKSCDYQDHCLVGVHGESTFLCDYLTRDDAIKLIEFLQLEYRLGEYGDDDYEEPECDHDFQQQNAPFGGASKLVCRKCHLVHQDDQLRQQARAEGLRANGITEEELAESARAHREAAELARGQ